MEMSLREMRCQGESQSRPGTTTTLTDNRGSTHDSENSLYMELNNRYTTHDTENSQYRNSAHDSENSLYMTHTDLMN